MCQNDTFYERADENALIIVYSYIHKGTNTWGPRNGGHLKSWIQP